MTIETTTIIHRQAFGTLDDALAYVRNQVGDGGIGGASVQIMVGSSGWPDPTRRYRVTVTVDLDTVPPRAVG